MPDELSWQDGFMAMTLALGDSIDDAFVMLGHHETMWLSQLGRDLCQADRRGRATTLAAALTALAKDVESARQE